MRKRLLGWLRPRRQIVASGDRAVAVGGDIGAVWSGDVASGPLPAGWVVTKLDDCGRYHEHVLPVTDVEPGCAPGCRGRGC